MKKIYFLIWFIVAFFHINAQVYFSENFNRSNIPAGWLNIDNDGDGYRWGIFDNKHAGSASWILLPDGNGRGLRPDNWLITPAIDLTSVAAGTCLVYEVRGFEPDYYKEHYKVVLSTTNTNISSFTNVLYEETIPYFAGTASAPEWISRKVNLDAFFGETVYIAFVHCNTHSINMLLLDNIEIKVLSPDMIKLESLNIPEFVQLGTVFDVKGSVTNMGSNNLTSYTVTYNLNGGANVAAYQVTGIDIPYGSTHQFTHNLPVSSERGIHTVNVTVSEPNGDSDPDLVQTASVKMSVYNNTVPRKVLLEQFTLAQSEYCLPVHAAITNWLKTRPNVIQLTHHAGPTQDGLTILTSTDLLVFHNGFPSSPYVPAIMLDRTYFTAGGMPGPIFFPDTSYTLNILDQALSIPAFVTVNFSNYSFDMQTREFKLTVSGEFVDGVAEDDLRLSLYIKENNLKTAPGQAGSSEGAEYLHQNVIRATYSGTWGDKNVITSGAMNSTYSKEYTGTIPEEWKVEDLSFIAFVSKYNDNVNKREVLNLNILPLIEDTSIVIVNIAQEAGITISPNPTRDQLQITSYKLQIGNMDYSIYSVMGQLVMQGKLPHSDQYISTINMASLPSGMYYLRIAEKTVKFVKQ